MKPINSVRRVLQSPDTSRALQGVVLVLGELFRNKPKYLSPDPSPLLHKLTSVLKTENETIEGVQEPLSQDNDLLKEDVLTSEERERLQLRYGTEVRNHTWKEEKVPDGRTARVLGFGNLAFGLVAGGIGEAINRIGSSSEDKRSSVFLSASNSERLANSLCRMRGAALKIGQILSIQEDSVLPPPLKEALERARQNADIMPQIQLESVLEEQLGKDWQTKFSHFDTTPFAAASLGQVHKARLPDGSDVAVKVQFPGVSESIDSDLRNLKTLASVTGVFPKGLFIDNIIDVMKDELKEECDYIAEAAHQTKFRRLLEPYSQDFFIPAVISDLSTDSVLVTEWAEGIPIDKAQVLPQKLRNSIGERLLRLSLMELFEFRYMQTDPNYSNYLYNIRKDQLCLLDFGATRAYGQDFVNEYFKLVWAASNGDRKALLDSSLVLGFLTGDESQQMIDAHIDAALEIGRPFQSSRPFDFRQSMISSKMKKHGATFASDRLTPPPREVYSLHRRLSGAFMTCIRIGAVFNCRHILTEFYTQHKTLYDV